jgi:beta-barrel assembly-enhancing protease
MAQISMLKTTLTVLAGFSLTQTAFALDFGLDQIRQTVETQIEETTGIDRQSQKMMTAFSEEDEIEIGKEIAARLLGGYPLVKNDEQQKYINKVGRWITLNSERPNLPWRFGLLDTDGINAFAAPGGYIFITKGLYQLFNDESELAAVLAHEIAHVLHQHHIQILRQGMFVDQGSKWFSKSMQSSEHAGMAKNIVGNGAEIFARGLDKSAEFEADRDGVILATRAGYDPYSLAEVLQKLAFRSHQDSQVALLFKTHPHPNDRLSELELKMTTRLDKFNPENDSRPLSKFVNSIPSKE